MLLAPPYPPIVDDATRRQVVGSAVDGVPPTGAATAAALLGPADELTRRCSGASVASLRGPSSRAVAAKTDPRNRAVLGRRSRSSTSSAARASPGFPSGS
ncbi:MAG: hypothetical protein ACRDST_18930 [Pseudonocardiaceae bacterium]